MARGGAQLWCLRLPEVAGADRAPVGIIAAWVRGPRLVLAQGGFPQGTSLPRAVPLRFFGTSFFLICLFNTLDQKLSQLWSYVPDRGRQYRGLRVQPLTAEKKCWGFGIQPARLQVAWQDSICPHATAPWPRTQSCLPEQGASHRSPLTTFWKQPSMTLVAADVT